MKRALSCIVVAVGAIVMRPPDFGGAAAWLNSAPISDQALRGKVVLVDFWTYSCINSLRELPYVRSWAAKYKDAGLVVIGVHTPEFSFEKLQPNVERALGDYQVVYPVPMDNDYKIWNSFDNEYWPADYIMDGKGKIRYHHFGEGSYDKTERVIQQLLRENGATIPVGPLVSAPGTGIELAPSENVFSPETYVGYRRADQFVSSEPVARDTPRTYTAPTSLGLNQWALRGSWSIAAEGGVLQTAPGSIVFRFHARDLHLVAGPTKPGTPIHFKVTIDGAPPGDSHGLDTSPDGTGTITTPRLYQLLRQSGPIRDRTFEIQFLDPTVEAYVFTFG
jgi:thiol-disulfide isomerase/thioredoxin